MTNRYLHLPALIILLLFAAYTVLIAVRGLGTITFGYTVLSMLSVCVLGAYAVRIISGRWKSEHILFFAVTAIALILVEAVLRFGIGTRKVYSEKNGSPFYASFYGEHVPGADEASAGTITEKLRIYPAGSERLLQRKEYAYAHRYNNWGIRDRDLDTIKPKGQYRILVLGDSFTEGEGAPQDSSWVALLEDRLNEAADSAEFLCINAGTAGSDPVHSAYMLEYLLPLRPDVVILAMNTTEIGELIVRGGFDRYDPERRNAMSGPWWEGIYAASFICRHTVHGLLGYNQYLMSDKEMIAASDQALEEILRVMSTIEARSKQYDFSILVVFHPHYHELYSGNPAYAQFSAYARSIYTFPIINLEGCFYQKMKENGTGPMRYYWPVDNHHNSRGYQLFADCIFNMIDFSRAASQGE